MALSPEMSQRLSDIVQLLPMERAMQVRNDLLALGDKDINSMDDLPENMRDALLEVEANRGEGA